MGDPMNRSEHEAFNANQGDFYGDPVLAALRHGGLPRVLAHPAFLVEAEAAIEGVLAS